MAAYSALPEQRVPAATLDRAYRLRCCGCGRDYHDDGYRLDCDDCGSTAILKSEFDEPRFRPRAAPGPFRYADWLPHIRPVESPNLTSAFPAPEIGRALGLNDLWLAFTGYWPERDCHAESFTFKELEAVAVLGRLPEDARPLAIASAGNTASAFALLCTRLEVPCLIGIPSGQLSRMRLATPFGPTVRIVAFDNIDYTATIAQVAELSRAFGLQPEGGYRNVGRRDGMATVMYAAYEAIGRLPDYYFQAVGSGSGAIAAHDAAVRLGGAPVPRMFLCQDSALAPIFELWRGRRAEPTGAAVTMVPELTNRNPPYHVTGGVGEVLRASAGDVVVTDGAAAAAAAALFESTYGIDLEPPAAVALAGLRAAAAAGKVDRDACVLVNVTGGGRRVRSAAGQGDSLVPSVTVNGAAPAAELAGHLRRAVDALSL